MNADAGAVAAAATAAAAKINNIAASTRMRNDECVMNATQRIVLQLQLQLGHGECAKQC